MERFGVLDRQRKPVRLAVLLVVAVGTAMLAFAMLRPADALSGTIEGRAATAQGSILGVGVSVNAITLPADGSAVSAGVALDASADADVVAGTLVAGATSSTASTFCEGVPSNAVVFAECESLIEDLDVGVTLETLTGDTAVSIVTADALQATSTSTDDGSGPTSSSETVITGLCVYLDGTTCTAVTGSGTFNISIAGLVTGTVEVVAEETRTMDGGVEGSGLIVRMLRIDIDAVGALGGIDVIDLDIVIADSFVGGVIDDTTNKAVAHTGWQPNGDTDRHTRR